MFELIILAAFVYGFVYVYLLDRSSFVAPIALLILAFNYLVAQWHERGDQNLIPLTIMTAG